METMTIFDKCFVFFEFLMKNPTIIFIFFLIFLLGIFLLNKKISPKIKNVFFVILYFSIMIILWIRYHKYFLESVDSVVTILLSNLYFPSLGLVFLLFIIAVLLELYILCSKTPSNIEKNIYTFFFSIYQFFFISLFWLIEKYHIDLSDSLALYENKNMMSILNLEILTFILWILVYIGIKYFYFLKNRVEKKHSILEIEDLKRKLKNEKIDALQKIKEELQENKEREISLFKVALVEEVKRQFQGMKDCMKKQKEEDLLQIEKEIERQKNEQLLQRVKQIELAQQREFAMYKEKLEKELRIELQVEAEKKKISSAFISQNLDDIEILEVTQPPSIEILDLGDDV